MLPGRDASDEPIQRERLVYRGIVQGVGFRPAVYRCATSLGLTGFVRNERSAVVVEVQGPAADVHRFREVLRATLPAAARVDEVAEETVGAEDAPHSTFRIAESVRTSYTLPPIPPDLALCPDCARELLDPADRRYLYPFITCTQCGPRYSITEDTPFDRSNTTMARFPLCADCQREYDDPSDRRFHAETISCPRCGPRLSLLDGRGSPVAGDPVERAILALSSGAVVAVLGIGGMHLAADPTRDGVRKLRRDKQRERKPFALMVRDLDVARGLCRVEATDAALLCSAASPIVIMPAAGTSRHLRAVSDTGTLGIMLPYTPLHLLLFRHPGMSIPYDHLIMTSGNVRDEPIITDPEESLRSLAGIADCFLVHDRRIAFRTDDSVLRGTPACILRRSRGHVPGLIRFASPVSEPTLAVGGDLKSAPALALGADLHVAPYIGDLDNLACFDAFVESVRRMLELYHVEPARVVYDAHPGYRSARWAAGIEAGAKVAVQHHHAHILSVMAEHGLDQALGMAFDGTGYGTDGTIWGGEFLRADRRSFARLGSFASFPLPGGEAAVRHPARAAFALLRGRFAREAARVGLRDEERRLVSSMLDRGVSSPLTSSLGRVFDCAAAALGIVDVVSYEGEGPIRLEGIASACRDAGTCPEDLDDLVPIDEEAVPFRLDAAPLVARMVAPDAGGSEVASLALLFHRAIANAALRAARLMRARTGISVLALSGGVFQNTLLRSLLVPALEDEGFVVCANRDLPSGDGGLCAGQAWYLPDFAGQADRATLEPRSPPCA